MYNFVIISDLAKYGPISNFFSPILPEMGQLNAQTHLRVFLWSTLI